MYDLLKGFRIIEASSFVAAPSAGLYLSQLGAEVIRIDQIGGGPDFHRWPLSANGHSLFWEGLNRGKKSVALDLKTAAGREILVKLACAPGPRSGILLTNFPSQGFLSHANLCKTRPDQITVRVMGWPDGTSAVDYTINPAVGIPSLTGPGDRQEPTNHVLPAWDLMSGSMAALSLIAAERNRSETGIGGEVRIPLSDVAFSTIANLGMLGEVISSGHDRPRYGNDLFGAFGRDFQTRDGARVMIVALTPRQWTSLIEALQLTSSIDHLEQELGVELTRDEGTRFRHRDRINPMVADAVQRYSLEELTNLFKENNVCWDVYRTVKEAYEHTPELVKTNPIYRNLRHPSGEDYPAPGFAGTFSELERKDPVAAPQLGAHTTEVLRSVLNYTEDEVRDLQEAGAVAKD